MNPTELLPPALRRPDTVVAPIAVGMSGAGVYRVEAAGVAYVLKVAPAGVDASDWRRKVAIHEAAAGAGLAPRIEHIDEAQRAVLSELVTDRGLMPRLFDPSTRPATIALLGTTVRRLHDTPPPADTPTADPIAMFRVLAATLEGFTMPAFARSALVRMLAETPPPSDRPLVLSHNDINPTNLVFDGERIVLLDWDTSGLNEPFYDLAALALFLRMDEATSLALVSAHDGQPVAKLPARFVYDRRAIGVLCGCAMLSISRTAGHPGRDESLESAPTMVDVYQRMRMGQLDVRTPEGQFQFGLALVRATLTLEAELGLAPV